MTRPSAPSLDRGSVRFGDPTVVDEVSASFTPGTVTALVGADGAGKTTLLRLLASRTTASSGTNTGFTSQRGCLGYQPAEGGVWPNLSVSENVAFVSRCHGTTRDKGRTAQLLEQAGLDRVPGRLARRLSGGMRRKLGLILATAHRPGLVLLDEPTTGVDPASRSDLWGLIAAAAARGATVVFSTTYLDEAERANRLLLLDAGRVVADGTPDEVIANAPGRIWRAPIAVGAAREALSSPHAWRRANTVYRWFPSPHDRPPARFESTAFDLENTSIALLLSRGRDTPATLLARRSRTRDSPVAGGQVIAEARDVSRRYGTCDALRRISLDVRAGEVVGLLGGNGAGKSTLMRILLGLEQPSAGNAVLFGARASRATRRRLGYAPQGLGLYPSLSALENLRFAARVHGIVVDDDAHEFASRLGRSPVAALPLGTQRLVAYVAASLHLPELLVLDEPTSGMDALSRARLWQALRSHADHGTGVLITTHYTQEAAQCDRLVVLTAGEVSASGTLAEITASHRSLSVETRDWEEAFACLRGAGLPVLLDGRRLRLPGVERHLAKEALGFLAAAATITEAQATLEETLLIGRPSATG